MMSSLERLKFNISQRIEVIKSNLLKPTGLFNKLQLVRCRERVRAFEDIIELIDYSITNDICVWEYDGVMYDVSPHDKVLGFYKIHGNDNYKFCPFCSRKIVVQESKHEET